MHCQSCEHGAMAEITGATLTARSEPDRVPALRVSYNHFRPPCPNPAIGRAFRRADEPPAHSREAILADSILHSRLAAEPRIVGRALHINGEPYTVVGVMPSDFRLPVGDQWGPGIGNVEAPQPMIFRPLGIDVSRAH